MRTDQQIVDETNELARHLLAEVIGTGYQMPEGHKFYEAYDPRSRKAWEQAVIIMEMTTHTDANDALSNLEPEPKVYRLRIGVTVRAFGVERFEAASWEEAIAKAQTYNPRDFCYGHDYENIEGDEIGYLSGDNDEDFADPVEVDLREDGEPYSWNAVQIVKDLAKLTEKDAAPALVDVLPLLTRAKEACAKERSDDQHR